jgi:hypothetical protein
VKKHFGVRALVSLLMLVVDYEVPVDCNTADVFNAWVRVINAEWAKSHQLDAQAWASEQSLIASGALVQNNRVRPTCIDSLPYRTEFMTIDMGAVATALEANRSLHTNGGQKSFIRMQLDSHVIQAVKVLPNFERAILRGAFAVIEEQCTEFDDVRVELIGMAFDLANGIGDVDMYSLSTYARKAYEERVAKTSAPTTINQTQTDIANECGALCALLIEKNRKYGDSALNPVHIFSKDPAHVQLRQQIDHKIARIKRSDESIEDEDVTRDLIGYLVLYRIALQRWKKGQTNANQVL